MLLKWYPAAHDLVRRAQAAFSRPGVAAFLPLHVLSSFRKQAIKRRIESLALAVLGPVRSSGAHASGLVDRYRRLSAPRLGAPESAALARCKYSARYPVAEVQYLPL